MNTQDKGDHAELRVASALKRCGWTVLMPYSESKKYDLVAERDGEFVRVQVKSSRWTGTSIKFPCYCSNSSKSGSNRTDYTREEIDGFGVYCDQYETCFWIPVEESNRNSMSLNAYDVSAENPANEYLLRDRFE